MSAITVRIDAALDDVQQARQRHSREVPSARRALRLAELYEQEARLWSALFEHSRVRVQWRAALAAELYARECARRWRWRAQLQEPSAPTSEYNRHSVIVGAPASSNARSGGAS